MPSATRTSAALLTVSLLLAGCGGDDDGGTVEDAATTTAVETTTSETTTSETTATTEGSAAGGEVPDACELVPTEEATEVSGLQLAEGESIGNELRSVCAFTAMEEGDVGVTVGVETTGRFDEKAEASRNALEVDGEEIADLGDQALYFFSDEDIPEGIGGVLVGVGDITIDISVQGAGGEGPTREASEALARLAVENL